jgi:galactokinase
VNLIGDHTDYTGGLVLPMAIDRDTTVEGERGGDTVRLRSDGEEGEAVVPLAGRAPADGPEWARYVAAVVAEVGPRVGLTGNVRSTIPAGAGLSSSAALEVALTLALGFEGSAVELARRCQRAEQAATGLPTGIMDQLVSAAAVAGSALLIDCASLATTPIALPEDVEVVVAHSGQRRALGATAYAERVAQCRAAERMVGPLREATPDRLVAIEDPLLRRRAGHVVGENRRVQEFADALAAGDLGGAGALMTASHASLRDAFEVSTPGLDRLVDDMAATPGVYGARLTGAGFGGCAVALARPGAALPGWRVAPAPGAELVA